MSSFEAAKATGQVVAHSALGADLPIIAGVLMLLGAYVLVVALLVFTARWGTEGTPRRA